MVANIYPKYGTKPNTTNVYSCLFGKILINEHISTFFLRLLYTDYDDVLYINRQHQASCRHKVQFSFSISLFLRVFSSSLCWFCDFVIFVFLCASEQRIFIDATPEHPESKCFIYQTPAALSYLFKPFLFVRFSFLLFARRFALSWKRFVHSNELAIWFKLFMQRFLSSAPFVANYKVINWLELNIKYITKRWEMAF